MDITDTRALTVPLATTVLPALLGWKALLLLPFYGILLLAFSFTGTLGVDLRFGDSPEWYPALRRPLSFCVIFNPLLGFLF